jgi:nucleotide-binding universal stress UspA family protein
MGTSQKILIALDGSEHCMRAVDYVRSMVPPEGKQVVLFHVLPEVPEPFFDFDVSEPVKLPEVSIAEWQRRQKERAAEMTGNACEILTGAGFSAGSIQIKIQSKQTGYARDILEESKQGYQALVVGRIGLSNIAEIGIGSLTTKLLSKMSHIPIVIVGQEPEPGRVLIAFDGSGGSKSCVRCVGALMAKPETDVILCYVVRPLNVYQTGAEFFKDTYQKEWLETRKRNIIPAISDAKKNLAAAGFQERRIFIEIISESESRAGAVVREANTRRSGTIVVGRRGLTIVDEFMIGRVSTKVVHLATDKAIWVVN